MHPSVHILSVIIDVLCFKQLHLSDNVVLYHPDFKDHLVFITVDAPSDDPDDEQEHPIVTIEYKHHDEPNTNLVELPNYVGSSADQVIEVILNVLANNEDIVSRQTDIGRYGVFVDFNRILPSVKVVPMTDVNLPALKGYTLRTRVRSVSHADPVMLDMGRGYLTASMAPPVIIDRVDSAREYLFLSRDQLVSYLVDKWFNQDGVCPFTDIEVTGSDDRSFPATFTINMAQRGGLGIVELVRVG